MYRYLNFRTQMMEYIFHVTVIRFLIARCIELFLQLSLMSPHLISIFYRIPTNYSIELDKRDGKKYELTEMSE